MQIVANEPNFFPQINNIITLRGIEKNKTSLHTYGNSILPGYWKTNNERKDYAEIL